MRKGRKMDGGEEGRGMEGEGGRRCDVRNCSGIQRRSVSQWTLALIHIDLLKEAPRLIFREFLTLYDEIKKFAARGILHKEKNFCRRLNHLETQKIEVRAV